MSEKVNENKRDTMTVLKPCKHEQGYCSGACEVEKVEQEKLDKSNEIYNNTFKKKSEFLSFSYFNLKQAAAFLKVTPNYILYLKDKEKLKFEMYENNFVFLKDDIAELKLKIRKSV
jgi:hypothetical protein